MSAPANRIDLRLLVGVYLTETALSLLQNHLWADVTWRGALIRSLQWTTPWLVLAPQIFRFDGWLHGRFRARRSLAMGYLGALGVVALLFWLLHLAVTLACIVTLGARISTAEALAQSPSDILENVLEAPFMFGVLLVASTAQRQARARRQSEMQAASMRAQLAESRLSTLERQIHPHFVFNVLQAVSTLLHREPAAADRAIVRLSELLRAMLDDVAHPEVTLRAELEQTRRYVELEQIRFQDRLEVAWDVDDALGSSAVPSLVILPLVENAIRHGLGPKVGRGRLTIAARRAGESLELAVSDDGVGARLPLREGVGLANTRERLRTLHGDASGFEVSAPPSGGFAVALRLPLRPLPSGR